MPAPPDTSPPGTSPPHGSPPSSLYPVYFSDVTANLNVDPPRIDFVRAEGSDAPPAEMRALRQKIEDMARVASIVFADDPPRLAEIFEELRITALSGLCSANYSVDIGLENLAEVQSHITDNFPRVRERLWRANLQILGVGGIGFLVLALLLGASKCTFLSLANACSDLDAAKAFTIAEAAVLIPFGVVVGLFIEFVLRVNDDLNYDQLLQINPGRWKPRARAFNTVMVAYVFAGLLGLKVIEAGLGPVHLDGFLAPNHPELAIAIGFVTGFAFPYVRDLIQKVRPTSGASKT